MENVSLMARPHDMSNVVHNLDFQFLMLDDGVAHLGRWPWRPTPAGEGGRLQTFADLPEVASVPNPTRLQRRDTAEASGLLMGWPGAIFDAFMVGRSTVAYMVGLKNRLTDAGFTKQALEEQMKPEGRKAIGAVLDAGEGHDPGQREGRRGRAEGGRESR